MVLLNDLESMKKFLNKKEILYRPNKFFLDMDDNGTLVLHVLEAVARPVNVEKVMAS